MVGTISTQVLFFNTRCSLLDGVPLSRLRLLSYRDGSWTLFSCKTFSDVLFVQI